MNETEGGTRVTRTFVPVLLITVAILCGAQPTTSNAAEDIYFLCNGTATSFRSGGGHMDLGEQEIAAHIANGKISFSGSHVLLGKDIRICTPDDDEPYFDSQTCGGKVDLDKERQHGT